MPKKFFLLILLLFLNNCATSGSAFLGPVFTGAKTGSIYQASLSYGTGKIMNELMPSEVLLINDVKLTKLDKPLPYISVNNQSPIIISYYKVDSVKFSEVIEPEPLP